jgi:hypothetical protein
MCSYYIFLFTYSKIIVSRATTHKTYLCYSLDTNLILGLLQKLEIKRGSELG